MHNHLHQRRCPGRFQRMRRALGRRRVLLRHRAAAMCSSYSVHQADLSPSDSSCLCGIRLRIAFGLPAVLKLVSSRFSTSFGDRRPWALFAQALWFSLRSLRPAASASLSSTTGMFNNCSARCHAREYVRSLPIALACAVNYNLVVFGCSQVL
eukprot:3856862-Pleurochrysis_carterae.AAC.3